MDKQTRVDRHNMSSTHSSSKRQRVAVPPNSSNLTAADDAATAVPAHGDHEHSWDKSFVNKATKPWEKFSELHCVKCGASFAHYYDVESFEATTRLCGVPVHCTNIYEPVVYQSSEIHDEREDLKERWGESTRYDEDDSDDDDDDDNDEDDEDDEDDSDDDGDSDGDGDGGSDDDGDVNSGDGDDDDDHDHGDGDRGLVAFRRWLAKCGFWLHPRLCIAAVDGKGLGVVVLRGPPVPAGTIIMRCPERLGLRADASAFMPELRKLRRRLDRMRAPPLSEVDELILTVGYELALGAASTWAPYLAWLPLTPTRELPVPLLWTERERAAVSSSPVLTHRIDAERAELADHYATVIAPTVAMLWDPSSVAIASERDYARIGAVVRGYAFTDVYGTGQELARLLPLVDVMNHSSSAPNVSILLHGDADDEGDAPIAPAATAAMPSTAPDGPVMVARTTAAIWAGGEAMLSYGRLSSIDLLSRYGFVPQGLNPHDEVALSASVLCEHVLAAAVDAHSRLSAADQVTAVERARDAVRDAGLLGSSDDNGDDEDDDIHNDGGGVSGESVISFRSGHPFPPALMLMVRLACLHLGAGSSPYCADPQPVDEEALGQLAADLEAGQDEAGDDEDALQRVAADVQMRHALLQFPASDEEAEARCLRLLFERLSSQVIGSSSDDGSVPHAASLLSQSKALVALNFNAKGV